MAKKKAQPRRVPRASEPRMYGDGTPSQAPDTAQPAPQTSTPAARTAGVRSPSATPRTSVGAAGSYARGGTSLTTDYTYVKQDLRRLGIVAASIIGVLVLLGIIIP